jgi:hypothetical protein
MFIDKPEFCLDIRTRNCFNFLRIVCFELSEGFIPKSPVIQTAPKSHRLSRTPRRTVF